MLRGRTRRKNESRGAWIFPEARDLTFCPAPTLGSSRRTVISCRSSAPDQVVMMALCVFSQRRKSGPRRKGRPRSKARSVTVSLPQPLPEIDAEAAAAAAAAPASGAPAPAKKKEDVDHEEVAWPDHSNESASVWVPWMEAFQQHQQHREQNQPDSLSPNSVL